MREVIEATWGWHEAWQRADFDRRFTSYAVSIIEIDHQSVGSLWLEWKPDSLYIHEVQIAPAFQGKGFGTAVLRHVIEQSAGQTLPVTLSVVPANPRAKQLYERLGFEVTAVEPPFIRMRHSACLKGASQNRNLEQRSVNMNFRIEYLADHVEAIPALAYWHHAQWAAITPHLTIPDREARFRARALRGSVPTGFVALINESVVGSACLIACDLDSHAHLSPWLASVLVAPQYRGRGIGSALSERAITEALGLGFAQTFLFTFDQQRFYQRMGWSTLEEATYLGHPVTVMVHNLAG
jgi:GNAT superfamily N-acetyltransferase